MTLNFYQISPKTIISDFVDNYTLLKTLHESYSDSELVKNKIVVLEAI